VSERDQPRHDHANEPRFRAGQSLRNTLLARPSAPTISFSGCGLDRGDVVPPRGSIVSSRCSSRLCRAVAVPRRAGARSDAGLSRAQLRFSWALPLRHRFLSGAARGFCCGSLPHARLLHDPGVLSVLHRDSASVGLPPVSVLPYLVRQARGHTRGYSRGRVTPCWPWYFPFLSLYETSGSSSPLKKRT
jgi:hypothetical protein